MTTVMTMDGWMDGCMPYVLTSGRNLHFNDTHPRGPPLFLCFFLSCPNRYTAGIFLHDGSIRNPTPQCAPSTYFLSTPMEKVKAKKKSVAIVPKRLAGNEAEGGATTPLSTSDEA